MKINFEKTRDVCTPIYSSKDAAGLDFFIPFDVEWESKLMYHGDNVLIPSGIKIEIPENYCMLAINKSSLGAQGLSVGACLIDSDYRGEIHLNVFNNSNTEISIKRGQKLVQFIVLSALQVELLEAKIFSQTARNTNGFGSTGL